MSLIATHYLGLKVCREIINAITFFGSHLVLGFIHIACIALDLNVGGGIKLSNELTAKSRMAVVNHNHRLVAHYLRIVDERVKWRINNCKHNKENNHCLISKDELELLYHRESNAVQPPYFFAISLHR